jgi:hypothetical protein
MIEGERYTLYPASHLVRVDGRLFYVPGHSMHGLFMHCIDRGEHKVFKLFNVDGGQLCRRIEVYAPSFAGITSFSFDVLGFICDGQVLKIQAWWRRVVRERVEQRLALAMGLHTRLGVESPLVALCDDHLRLIQSVRAPACRGNGRMPFWIDPHMKIHVICRSLPV